MKKFKFERETPDDLIFVKALIDSKFEYNLVLDTAATHTTIDSNMLYLSGYELKESLGEINIETSNGVIIVERYQIEKFECLGLIYEKFEVHVYDFLSHGVTSSYDGVLGLNFLGD